MNSALAEADQAGTARNAQVPAAFDFLVKTIESALQSSAPDTERRDTAGVPDPRILEQHDWPDNITELYALVTHLAQRTGGGAITAEQVQALLRTEADFRLPRAGINLSELAKNLLRQAMNITSNNQTRAADLLGLTRDQPRYRLAKFELSAAPARTG